MSIQMWIVGLHVQMEHFFYGLMNNSVSLSAGILKKDSLFSTVSRILEKVVLVVKPSPGRDKVISLLLVSLVEVMRDVPLKFVHQQRSSLGTTSLVTDRVLDLNFIQNSAIVEFDQEGITDGTFGRVMVVHAEALILDTVHFGAESVNAGISGRGVGAVIGALVRKDWSSGGALTSSGKSARRR
jgi:hypothetical protein